MLPFRPLALLPQCWVSSAHYVYHCISWWIVSDRQYFTIRLALLMIYLLTSGSLVNISSLPGANPWKYFCLFTQYPNSSFQIHFRLFDSDSDSDFVFICVRTLHTLCALGSAQHYAVSVFVWTIGQLIEMFAQKAKWNWKENSLEKKQRRMEKRKMSK